MTDRLFVCLSELLLVALASSAVPLRGQSLTPADTIWQHRWQELDQKQRLLERKWELAQEEAAAQAKAAPVLMAGRDGFSLKSADSAFLLRLRAHSQLDGRFFLDDAAAANPNTLVNRRMRFVLEGTLNKIFDFKFMPDFAGSRLVLQDFFLDVRLWPQLKFKAGKFKTPFGLERLQSPTNLLFIERGLPNNLVPNRDLGVQLHGDLAGGVVNYMAGIFNGVVDGGSGDGDSYDSKDLAARLWLSPFSKTTWPALRQLSLGFAATSGTQQGTPVVPNLPGYNTPAQQSLFRYRSDGTAAGTVIANGEIRRFSPQGYYSWGRLGLLAEYVIARHQVTRGSAAAALEHRAWQMAVSYSLTGEAAAYKGLTPLRTFDRDQGVLGSFEIVARYNVLAVDPDAFPVFANPQSAAQQAKAWALGWNWYLNRNVKVVLNYEHTTFSGGAAGGDRPDEKALLTRVQVGF